MFAYLAWLCIFLVAPTALMSVLFRGIVVSHRRTLLLACVLSLAFAVPWDAFSTYAGIWSFPSSGVLGVYLLNLPIEEYFFIVFGALTVSIFTLVMRHYARKGARNGD